MSLGFLRGFCEGKVEVRARRGDVTIEIGESDVGLRVKDCRCF